MTKSSKCTSSCVAKRSPFFNLWRQVARMCQDRMHELVVDAYKKAVSGKEAAAAAPAWKDVMEKGFARMDDEATIWAKSRTGGEPACRCELQTPARCDHVGSTAVVAVVGPNRVVVANSGDSRAVLCRAGVPVPLSVDHKVSSKALIQRRLPRLLLRIHLSVCSSRTGRTSWSASRRRAAASSTGTAPGCSASSPCLEPSVRAAFALRSF
jgi:hypothetical protein